MTIHEYRRHAQGHLHPAVSKDTIIDMIWIRNRSFRYAQQKTVNLTEMRVEFEFFPSKNLFVSGPVFDCRSNERGLVRVCGYLGAVLCGAIGVRRFSSVSKFEFLTIFR